MSLKTWNGREVLGMCMHTRAEESEKEDLIRIDYLMIVFAQRHDCICS